MESNKSSLKDFIKKVPFLETLKDENIDELAHLFREKTYKKGEVMFREGDRGDDLFIIKEGAVKIYREEEGKEVILSILKDGDYFGEMAILQFGQDRSAFVATIEPSIMYMLRRNDFITILEKRPSIAPALLDVALARLRKTNNHVKNLTTLDARSRVMINLIELVQEHGVKRGENVIIDIKLTHQHIANMVGSSRETVTRVLTDLQKENAIYIEEKKVVIKKLDYLYQELNMERN